MSQAGEQPTRVLMICMGNICRSPMAEAMFVHLARGRGVLDQFEIDSAGTGGWHTGHPPDERMQEVARHNAVVMNSRARQVTTHDFEAFDLLVCMDDENHRDLRAMGAPVEKLHRLLDFHPDPPTREVPDPYYGEHDGFQLVFDLVQRACDGLLNHLIADARSH